MTRRRAIVAVATLAASAACGVKADGPPQIELDRTPCAHCGMLISETMFAAAYRTSSAEARVFDDIGCLLASAKREADSDGLRFWFHDFTSGDWIAGADATFVKSERLRTPMSGGLIAYRDAGAAQRGAAQHEGQVVPSLSDLFRARVERLRPERGDGLPAEAPARLRQGYGGQPSLGTGAKVGVNRGEAAAPSEKRAGGGPREH